MRPDVQGLKGPPTPGQARGPGWRQTTYGFYVLASVTQAVPVPPPSGLRRLEGSLVSREPYSGGVRFVAGIPVASPVRSLFDEMRRLDDPREAVVAMDMMAAAVQVSIAECRDYLAPRTSWRRARQVVWALDLDGRLICIADLLDPAAGVVGEYDGATHLRLGRRVKDVDREKKCRQAALEYFKITSVDLLDRLKVVARMRATRARAPRLRGAVGRWTLKRPAWWNRETAEDALAHRDWLREGAARA